MIGFVIGLILGGGIGVFATALCVAAGNADRYQSCCSDPDFLTEWGEIGAEAEGEYDDEE